MDDAREVFNRPRAILGELPYCELPSLMRQRTCLDVEHMSGVVLCRSCRMRKLAAAIDAEIARLPPTVESRGEVLASVEGVVDYTNGMVLTVALDSIDTSRPPFKDCNTWLPAWLRSHVGQCVRIDIRAVEDGDKEHGNA